MPTPPGGAAPAGETVRILEIAGALLADEAAWDRSPIRTDDPVNGRYTLYSALATACHQVTSRYSHRHPALEAVRAAIQDRVPGRRWKHRLAEFNAEASFDDVKAVLTSAIAANVALHAPSRQPPRSQIRHSHARGCTQSHNTNSPIPCCVSEVTCSNSHTDHRGSLLPLW